jgi:glycosyltransferase involved in cell wall biosynthesis
MNVLMVISQLRPIVGGAERQAELLAHALIKKGVNVTIVTGWWKFGTPREETMHGIEIRRNFSCWGMFGVKGIRPLGALTYMITLGIYLILHRKEYDIIHVHQALYPAFISVLMAKRFLGKPVIVKSASSGMTSDIRWLSRFLFGRLQLKYLLKHMGWLVAVSRATGQEFEQIGFPSSKILYIPNGVEIPVGTKSSSHPMIHTVTTARMSKEKGIDVLLKAWANLSPDPTSLRLTIIGDGPQRYEIERAAQDLGIAKTITFTGWVNNVYEYLRETDIFVLPSRTEGMSNALLEAMSYGIPCIATNVGGNSELLEGNGEHISLGKYAVTENGLLINPDDVKGLTEAILFFMSNREKREEIGKRGRSFILENYSIDRVAERYKGLYKSILNESL